MTDQTGAEVIPGAEGVVEGQPSEHIEEETRTVPLSVLKTVESKYKESQSEIERLRAEAEEAKRLREQMELYRQAGYNQQPPHQHVQPQPQEPSFDIGDDDIIDGAKMKQILKDYASTVSQRLVQNPDLTALKQELATLRLAHKDPDYENTIKTYLPKLINEDPAIANVIRSSQDPMGTALALSLREKKSHEARQQTAEVKPQGSFLDDLTQIIENANKPKSPATAGSGAATLSGASRFASMTPEEFAAHKAKVLAGQLK